MNLTSNIRTTICFSTVLSLSVTASFCSAENIVREEGTRPLLGVQRWDMYSGKGKAVPGDPYRFLSKAKVDKKIIPDRLPGHLLFKENIVYTPGTDTKLRDLDILYHMDHKTVTRPAILVIHGGGWRGGDKIRGHEIMAIYALQGYVTVSVDAASIGHGPIHLN